MKISKRTTCLILVTTLFLSMGLLSGCSSNEPEARKALESYLTSIQSGDYKTAYQLVSDFDKKSITEEVFDDWRLSADKITKKKSFSIGKKVDKFGSYEYLGTRFKEAYGFDVKWEQEYLVDGAKTTDYDKDDFKIMVVKEEGGYKVALLIKDLKERAESYKKIKE